jgi:hypothetical protein
MLYQTTVRVRACSITRPALDGIALLIPPPAQV